MFYLRAGYTPDDYSSDTEWQARRDMESCTAVSCPSVAYQLVGAKKIQQDLARPGAQLPFTDKPLQGLEKHSVVSVHCRVLTMCSTKRACKQASEEASLTSAGRLADQLRRFVTSEEDVETLQACFAGLWSLDDLQQQETKDIVARAIESPSQFVLKPQREGGGNNLYGTLFRPMQLASMRRLCIACWLERSRSRLQATSSLQS